MRVGILGGSFDPVHAGHLAIVGAAAARLKLDRILLVPARRSPLKKEKLTAPRHRVAMLRIALKGRFLGRVGIDTLELRRKAPSYTVDTLRGIKRRWPHVRLFLLLGADAAKDFRRWRRSIEVRRLAEVVVFPRPGHRNPKGFTALAMKPCAVSASGIREALARGGRLPRGCLASTAAYARRHRLYPL